MTENDIQDRSDWVGKGNLDTSEVIRLENISKFYGDVLGLNDVTISIGPGVTGLLGPNGAGKSTLMKLLTGQIKPDKGTIRAFGMPVWNNPKYYGMVGYCPEFEETFDRMTGLDFVKYLLRVSGYKSADADKMAKKAIKTCSMTKDMGRPIRTYSKGMRQRIKIAQAIAHNPKVLFLDEPLTGTDPIGRVDIINVIRDLGKKQGMTVLVSSHVLHEIERMTSHMLMIHRGRVIAWGDIEEIRSKLDQVPHSLIIRCNDDRKLARRLIGLEEVSSVQIDKRKDGIIVKVADPDSFYRIIAKVLKEEQVKLYQLGSLDDDLESLFEYLTTGEGDR